MNLNEAETRDLWKRWTGRETAS